MTDAGFKRKLTAILSADVLGYSRLMRDDEEATVRDIAAHRVLISDIVQQHHGRVVDSPGDNILAEFASVVDAVNGAIKIQEEIKKSNTGTPKDRRMEFRIGINLGDVIEEEERIYGDGVNIAARVEGLASAGRIAISGTVYEHIKEKLSLGYHYLGEQDVKNISEPIRVYRLLTESDDTGKMLGEEKPKSRKSRYIAFGTIGLIILVVGIFAIWDNYFRPKIEPASIEKMAYPLPDKPSIAVLPFDNLSGNPEDEFIADGISESIITALSKTPKMLVISRNSTFAYKGKSVKIQNIAEDLSVQYVLEGSLQKSNDQLRINAQLIDAITGNHLWAEKYDRNLKDIFVLQDDITMKIITALQVELSDGEKANVIARGTVNIEAFLKVIQGLHHFERVNKEGDAMAQKLAREAISLDSGYPAAYYLLSRTHMREPLFGTTKSPKMSLKLAIENAQKAVFLDKSFAEAEAFLGWLYTMTRQYDKGIAATERALALNFNLSPVYSYLGLTLNYAGKHKEAIKMFKKGIRLSPIPSVNALSLLCIALRDSGRYEEGISTAKKAISLSHGSLYAHTCLASCYALEGRDAEASAESAEILRIDPNFSLENLAKNLPYKNSAGTKLVIDSLIKAGLPHNPPLPLPDKPSIAVLAFDNLSGDPEQEYFSDGISENIITALSKVGELFVIARNSSFTYKGKPVKVQQVGRELGVRYVLEGSVQKSGNRVRINAQLIDAKNGQHLWAEKYDRDFKDVFEIQDEITMKIVTALQVNLTAGEQARVWSKETKNLEVYLKSIQAYSLMKEGKKESLSRYGQLAQEIVDMEPESPLGYRMLAWYHFDRWAAGISRTESYLKAYDMAEKALSLNESDPYSHALFGWLYRAGKSWDKAIDSGMRSVEFEPNGAYLHCLLGNTLMRACRYDEAFIHLKQAIRLNPFPAYFYYQYLGMCYFHNGQPQKALSEYKKALQLSSNDFALHGNLAVTYITLGRVEEARASREKSMELAPQSSIGWVSRNWSFKCRDNLERFLDAMRKAGFPE